VDRVFDSLGSVEPPDVVEAAFMPEMVCRFRGLATETELVVHFPSGNEPPWHVAVHGGAEATQEFDRCHDDGSTVLTAAAVAETISNALCRSRLRQRRLCHGRRRLNLYMRDRSHAPQRSAWDPAGAE
jgi:hypothetical protein